MLLSSTNRGFEPQSLSQELLRFGAEAVRWHSPLLDELRGSKWISDLRLGWIEMFGGVVISPDPPDDRGVMVPKREEENVPSHPKTIQIDGDRDEIVRPDDSADLALFEESVRQYVVRGITHTDFALTGFGVEKEPVPPEGLKYKISVGALGLPEPVPVPVESKKAHEVQLAELAGLIADAVVGDRDPSPPSKKPTRGFGLKLPTQLSHESLAAEPENSPGPPGDGITKPNPPDCPPGGWWAGGRGGNHTYDIIFMIHGIRDYGSWHPMLVEALEREIRGATGYWKIVPVEYGYFSALQFLIPIQQRRLARGFADRYINELTQADLAMIHGGLWTGIRIHAATHSNGCNVLAQAITGNDNIQFSRIFQAGCVLPRNFWDRKGNQKTASQVRNDCATSDWPVGVLCDFLGRLPVPAYRFLGSAGVHGFDGAVLKIAALAPASKGQFVWNNQWIKGGHGAAMKRDRMASIASYLVANNLGPANPTMGSGPEPMRGPRFLLWSGLILVPVGFGLFLGLLALLGWFAAPGLSLVPIIGGFSAIAYALAAVGLGFAAIAVTAILIALLLNV